MMRTHANAPLRDDHAGHAPSVAVGTFLQRAGRTGCYRALMALGLLAGCGASAAAEGPQAIRQVVEQAIQQRVMPGAVVLITHQGRVVFEQAFGMADLEQRRAHRLDDYFFLGSTSKPLAATTILSLVDQGGLRLDASPTEWMPELASPRLRNGQAARSPTLREMLSHTSGMYGNATADQSEQRLLWNFSGTLADTARQIAAKPLAYPPGQGFSYGGASITVAARVAEKISGREFDAYMDERLLKPLGMRDTFYRSSSDFRGRFSTLYQGGGGALTKAGFQPSARPGSFILPTGGVIATARDLAAFVQFHLDGCKAQGRQILSADMCREMRRDQTHGMPMDFQLGKRQQNTAGIGANDGYGLGWMLDELDKDGVGRVFYHGGAFGTLIWGDATADLNIVLLTQVPLAEVANTWDAVIKTSRAHWRDGAAPAAAQAGLRAPSRGTRAADYPVASERLTWRDPSRNRDVPVKIFGPAQGQAKGRLPLVVFSHGLGESRDAFDFLGEAWARRGYLAVFLTHPGADRDALKRSGMPKNQAENFDHRDRDMRFATDRAISGASGSALLDGRVDTQRMAVAGQCAGSTIALYQAGLNVNKPGAPHFSNPDQRFKAAIALSPQMPFDVMLAGTPLAGRLESFEGGARELNKGSWETIKVPTLVVTGGRDFDYFPSIRKNPALVRMAYDGLPAGNNYLVELTTAQHHAFTASDPWYPAGARDPRHFDMLAAATTTFLDAYMKADTAARSELEEGALEQAWKGDIVQADKSPGGGVSSRPYQATPAPAPAPSAPRGSTDLIGVFDRDGSGSLSRDEIPAKAERLRRAFDHIDSNDDGELSQQELDKVLSRFKSEAGDMGGAARRDWRSAQGTPQDSAAKPSASAPVLPIEAGRHAVAAIDRLHLRDAKGNIQLTVRVAYPTGGKDHPVIVFSHSLGRGKDSYNGLAEYWASHGFVCILPDHADSPNVSGGTVQSATGDIRGRARDLRLVVDYLPDIASLPELKGAMDTQRVGMAGHYVGAFAASLLAGADWDGLAADEAAALRDPRIRAALWISPQGTGQGMRSESWARVTLPALVVTGSADASPRTGKTAAWRTEPYELSAPGDKFLLFIDGYPTVGGARGAEISYDDIIGPANRSIVYRASGDFWAAYLRGDRDARARLRNGELQTKGGGAVRLSHR